MKNRNIKAVLSLFVAFLLVLAIAPVQSHAAAPAYASYSSDGRVYNSSGAYFDLHRIYDPDDVTNTKVAFCMLPNRASPNNGMQLVWLGNPIDLVMWGSLEKANLVCALLEAMEADKMTGQDPYSQEMLDRILTAIIIYDIYYSNAGWNQSTGTCYSNSQSEYFNGFYIVQNGITIDYRGNATVLNQMRAKYSSLLTDYNSALNKIMRERMAGTGGRDKSLFPMYTIEEYQYLIRAESPQVSANTLKISKTSEDGVKEGFCFCIVDESTGNGPAPKYTDANGEVTFTGIADGTWKIIEVDCPERYDAPNAETVTLSGGQSTTIYINNVLKRSATGSIAINKSVDVVNATTDTFSFKATNTSTNNTYYATATYISAKSWAATISNVPTGTYRVEEYNVPSHYSASAAQTITVTDNATKTVNFTNTHKTGSLTITKQSSDGNISNIAFTVTGDHGYSQKVYTDSTGKKTITNLPIGTYTVTEDQISGYKTQSPKGVAVNENQTAQVCFINEAITTDIQITKLFYSLEGDKVSDDATGITFILKSKTTGKEVASGTIQSGSDSVTLSNIPVGDYYLSEAGYDKDKYSPESDEKEITVKQVTGTQHFTFSNTRRYPSTSNLTITKAAEDGVIDNIEFTVSSSDGKYTEKKATDSNGTVVFKDLPVGTYYVEEVNVPERYEDIARRTITVTGKADLSLTITNTLKKGSLVITKTADDCIVKGIEFQIKSDVNSYKVTSKTDGSGVARFDNIPVGKYTVTEVLNSPGRYEGYTAQVEISRNTELKIDAHNELLPEYLSVIQVVKTDNETLSAKHIAGKSLEGAVFDIFNRSGKTIVVNDKEIKDGDLIMTLTTDSSGIAKSERVFPFGKYGVVEKTAPDGYHVNAKEELIEIGLYSATGSYELRESVIRNYILFDKIDSKIHEGLSNMVFRISLLNDDGKVIESHIAVTGKDGWFDSKALLSAITDETKAKVNGNDAAVNSAGDVDVSKLDATNPIFFYGYNTSKEYFAGDIKRGPLVQGRYLIEELLSDGEYVPITPREITVNSTEGYEYKLVLTDYAVPEIDTTLYQKGTELKSISTAKNIALTDNIYLNGVEPTESYIAYGQLYDKTTASPARDDKGSEIKAESKETLANTDELFIELEYLFDGESLADHSLVSYVDIYKVDTKGNEIFVTSHADLEDEGQSVHFINTYFTKVDAVSREPLKGAVIRITDKTANTIEEITSDENGRVYFSFIPKHKYSYQEITAPNGYKLDRSIYSFEIDEYGKPDIEPIITNSKDSTIILKKRNPLNGEPIEGAKLSVLNSSGTILFTQETDKLGQIYFDAAKYIAGAGGDTTFLFKEETAPDGYYLNTDTLAFTVSPSGEAKGSLIMEDVPKGTVAIKKTDQNGAPLPGAKISIYSSSTNKLLGQATSGSTGRIYFTPIEMGSYYFVEDEAPSGYERDTNKHSFTVTQSGGVSGETSLKNTKAKSGATGDESHIKLSIIVFAMLVLSAAFLLVIERRQKKAQINKTTYKH